MLLRFKSINATSMFGRFLNDRESEGKKAINQLIGLEIDGA